MLFNLHTHILPSDLFGIYQLALEEAAPLHTFYSVGLHPKQIDEHWPQKLNLVEKHLQNPYCKAIGECGLDAFGANKELQIQAFEAQIKLSKTYQKPLIIHCVKAFDECIKLCKNHSEPMVMHGFNKNINLAKQLIKHNISLSFGKAILYKLSLQEVFKALPLESIFLETDNDDVSLEHIYQKASLIKGISLPELENIICKNLEIFKLWQPNG
jgi:TatD DNase family protein